MTWSFLFITTILIVISSAWGNAPTGESVKAQELVDEATMPEDIAQNKVIKAFLSNNFDDLTPAIRDTIYSPETIKNLNNFKKAEHGKIENHALSIKATKGQFKDILHFLSSKTTAETGNKYLTAIEAEVQTMTPTLSSRDKLYFWYHLRLARLWNLRLAHSGKKRVDIVFTNGTTLAELNLKAYVGSMDSLLKAPIPPSAKLLQHQMPTHNDVPIIAA